MGDRNRVYGQQSDSAHQQQQQRAYFGNRQEPNSQQRIRNAEDIAANRNCTISAHLRQLLHTPEPFFHQEQQSAKMIDNWHTRQLHSYNTRRDAILKQCRDDGKPFPDAIATPDVNPTKITLSLEIESQYIPLMTNVVGDDEHISAIMQNTNTLIDLPDRPREDPQSPDPFTQQISITGNYRDVDRARTLIRQNSPMYLFLNLPRSFAEVDHLMSLIRSNSINYSPLIIDFYSANENPHGPSPYIRFTCRVKHEKKLLVICRDLIANTFGNSIPDNCFSIQMDISTYHIDHVIARPADNIHLMPKIEKKTGATIKHQGFTRREDVRGNVYPVLISGTVEAVLAAKKSIMDLLPVLLCFNLKDTDMKAGPEQNNRSITMFYEEDRTLIRMAPSLFEPKELLAAEVPVHCVSLRTKEFNMKGLYKSYGKMLKTELAVTPPQPTEFDGSMWIKDEPLPNNMMSIKMPCRGEAQEDMASRRARTASTTSVRSMRSHSNSTSREPQQQDYRLQHQEKSQIQNGPSTPTAHSAHHQMMHNQMMGPLFQQNMMAVKAFDGGRGIVSHNVLAAQQHQMFMGVPPGVMPFQIFNSMEYPKHPAGHGMRSDYMPSPNDYPMSFAPQQMMQYGGGQGFPNADTFDNYREQMMRKEGNVKTTTLQNRPINNSRNSNMRYNEMHHPPPQMMKYEEDDRNSIKSMAKRSSISGDEPNSDGCDDKTYNNRFKNDQYRYTRPPNSFRANTPNNRGDLEYNQHRKNGNYSRNRRHTEPQQQQDDGNQFRAIFQLPLKSISPDETERLYAQDCSTNDEVNSSPRKSYYGHQNMSMEGKSESYSFDDQRYRHNPNNSYEVVLEARSADGFKKTNVEKTILEHKTKGTNRVTHLEHRQQNHRNDPNMYYERNMYNRIQNEPAPFDFMKFANNVKEAKRMNMVLPPQRTFEDVLAEKRSEERAESLCAVEAEPAIVGVEEE